MRRRKFVATLSGAALVSTASVRAQQAAVPVIGVLHGVAAAQWTDRMVGFARGLAESGFVDGRNTTIEYRWADGQFERLPGMAADLVRRNAAVILAGASDVAIRAAMQATKTIPIVFTTASDPVRAGFVSSFNRPGGNLTGATFLGVELVAKRFELLRETVPGATRIALLVNPNNPGLMQDNIDLSTTAVQRLGLDMVIVKAGSEAEIESAVASAAQQQAHALNIGNDAYLTSRSEQIAGLALRYGLPTMSESRNGVVSGLLMSYGPNQAETFRQAALYVGRILKGDKPAELPIIQPTQIELFINLTTAKGLRIEIPPPVLARADEVIQ
jgi:putative ABC transport system substrate-binding protein